MAELRDVLSKSNTRMARQEDQMMTTGRAVQALVTQVSELTTQFQQLKTETASLQHPPAPNPPASVDQIVRSTEPVFHIQRFTPVNPSYVAHFWQNVPCTFLSNLRRFPLRSLKWLSL